MAKPHRPLGAILSVHGTSPAILQRAAIVAALSFLFFLTSLLLFYMQQAIGYFVLSSAFLVVYVFTMIGWVMQKRNMVSVHENGIAYRKFAASWDEIQSVKADQKTGITLTSTTGDSVRIPETVSELAVITTLIKSHLA